MHNSSPFVIPTDITAKVDEFMARNRIFSGWVMEEGATDAAAETSGDSATTEEASAMETADVPEVRDPAKLLSAYEAEKAKRREQDGTLRDLRTEFDAFRAKAEGKEAEFVAAQEAQRVKDEALAAANERILKADIRTAAKGKLNDPNDAFRYPEDIDLSAFEANADGEYDAADIAQAIDRLIEKKPYLAAQGQRFQGEVDGGTRNESAKSIDDQIAEAMAAGNHGLAISLKRQKAYANQT
jgi:hypothetical protein